MAIVWTHALHVTDLAREAVTTPVQVIAKVAEAMVNIC